MQDDGAPSDAVATQIAEANVFVNCRLLEGRNGLDQGSYSRTMTPDVVVAQEAAALGGDGRVIVLDAKYRIDDGLNDALGSIHTYRDALVLQPGSSVVASVELAFCEEDAEHDDG
ncbi:nuclease domain-containing protein, partial [Azospirillum aestuarii]|uniref:nuclease domain-containing protein n=1 Tax=Azospirillum aestuarii TaxID=2802052 RepID=UPI004054AFF4